MLTRIPGLTAIDTLYNYPTLYEGRNYFALLRPENKR